MAKVLKFDLMLDNCNVRSLEGLQEHFVIEYVLKYFEDGTLSRWLKVLNYSEQLAEVEAIDKTLDKKDIALQLAHIFGIENVDSADVEKALSVFSYLEKKQELTATVQENALFKKQAVEEYLADYEALIQHMIDNSGGNIVERLNKVFNEYELDDRRYNFSGELELRSYDYNSSERYRWCHAKHPYLHVNTDISINVSALKEDVQKLEQDYLQLVKLSFSELYFRLVEIAPMAIVAMLWSDTFRELLIGENAKVYLKDSFTRQLVVDKDPVLLGKISGDLRGNCYSYIFDEFARKFAVPNIDGLKIMFFGLKDDNEVKKIIENGNKVILLYSDVACKSANSDDAEFFSPYTYSDSKSGSESDCNLCQNFPMLCNGLIVKRSNDKRRYGNLSNVRGHDWPYRNFVIYMSA